VGERAYHRVQDLVEGKRLTVVTYEQYAYGGPQGTVGEWVGDIILTDVPEWGTGTLAAILLAEGLAVPYDGKGKRPSAL
jgi:endonuclease YncB( thermonuclease family)